jgi:predicted TIM-barrel fold metal-dependent hydrolase
MTHIPSRRLSFRGCTCCVAATPVSTPAPQRRRIDTRRVHAGGEAPRGGGAPTAGLFAAAAARGTATSTQSGSGTANAAKPHRIDTHHHIAPPKFVEEMRSLLQPPTINWSIEKSLEDMDKAGVATSITSITTPGVWIGDNEQGRRVARECNDHAARLCVDYPGRFGMFAALPLPNVEASLREIEHGLDVLKADGICLFTSYRDKWLGDLAFEPVMAELNRRKAVVYTHPEAPECCRNLIPGINEAVIEYGTDTTRAIARLLFSGTATRYPDIQWIFSHGGGVLPMLHERFVRSGRLPHNAPHLPNGANAELMRFHYDVAQIAHPVALAALTKMVPISQILWGTDFPFRFGWEYVKGLGEFGFSDADLRKIERENALALLPRWR